MAMQRLYDSAEIAKKELSTAMETEINLPFITMTDAGPQHLIKKITRAKFDSLIENIIKESTDHITTTLKDAGLNPTDIQEIIMVGGSTRVPLVQNEVQKYFNGKTLNKSVNPDEVVALGAAVQAGVLSGDVKDVLLLDVTPLTLGIETMGSVVAPIVEKGTTIPVKKSQIFTTAEDNQPAVSIVVTQGEAKLSKDNKLLGQFNLEGIAPARRGEPQIEVTFDIDANGVLNVSAVDKGTGKEQKITISGSSGLSDEEIEKMIREAEESNTRNKDKLEAIEAKNALDSVIAGVNKFIEDNKDSDCTSLEEAVKQAEEISKDDSKTKDEYDAAKSTLEQKYQEEAQKIMTSKTGDTGTNASEDDIIDAEVE